MKNIKLLLTTGLMALAVNAWSQNEDQLKSYHFIEAQGGIRTTIGGYKLFELTSPAIALSYGYMTQPIGFRLQFSGWDAKSSPSYTFKYINTNADLLLNITHAFSRNVARPLNFYLLGGVGIANTFDRETADANWKDHASLNLRIGLRLVQRLSKPLSLTFEVSANNMASHSNCYTYQDEKGLNAMIGIGYRFGHKYNNISKTEP